MFVILFLLWLLLNGRVTGEIVVIGLVLSGLLTVFAVKICNWKPEYNRNLWKLLPRMLCYGGRLFVEIIKSNLAVMRIILSPSLKGLEPKLFFFDSKLKDETSRVALANSITITPGTYTAGVYDSTMAVHALNQEFAQGAMESILAEELRQMEKITEETK